MIYELLLVGEEHAMDLAYLENFTGLPSYLIRDVIRIERVEGKPICSSSKGYFKPESIEDLKKTIHRLSKACRFYRKKDNHMKVIEAMRKCLERYKKSRELEAHSESRNITTKGRKNE